MFKKNIILIWGEGEKRKRITLILFWNVTYLVIKGQMVGSVAQGMLTQVHTHKDSFRGSAADGIH